MAISNNIDAIVATIIEEQDAWDDDHNTPTPVSDDVEQKATKAILGGVQDWVTYVSLFSSSAAELARLMPTTGTTAAELELNKVRGYLAADGMCGMGTGRHLKDRVTTKLD